MEYQILEFDQIDSTSAAIKRDAAYLQPGTVYASREQTGGYGRNGRSFVSEPGGLYFSVLLPGAMNEQLTVIAGAALAKAIFRLCGLQPQIKWLNDLMIENRKIAGILCESQIESGKKQWNVLGIGVNLSQKQFPSDLEGKAASLLQSGCRVPEARQLLEAFLEEFDVLAFADSSSKWLPYVNEHLAWKEEPVLAVCGSKMQEGIAKSVDAKGRLCLACGEKQVFLAGGEIHLLQAAEA